MTPPRASHGLAQNDSYGRTWCYGDLMPTDLVPTGSPVLVNFERDTRTLVAAWLLSHRSDGTRTAYATDLTRWVQWCEAHGLNPLGARRGHVDAWVRDMESTAPAPRPSSVARRIAAVGSFYKYAVDEGVLETSPVSAVRRPRSGEGYVELTPALDDSELGRLVTAAETPRDRALVLVLICMGLRVSEAITLDLDGTETVRGHVTVMVHGKGGTEVRMPVPPLVVAALDDLAAHEHRTTGPVFVDAEGQRWTRHHVTRALARLGRRANITRTVRPHQMRATCITRALDLGATLRDVQDLARHSDPRTTRRYDRARGAFDRSPVYALAASLAGTGPVGA